jgi:hypothetical protein
VIFTLFSHIILPAKQKFSPLNSQCEGGSDRAAPLPPGCPGLMCSKSCWRRSRTPLAPLPVMGEPFFTSSCCGLTSRCLMVVILSSSQYQNQRWVNISLTLLNNQEILLPITTSPSEVLEAWWQTSPLPQVERSPCSLPLIIHPLLTSTTHRSPSSMLEWPVTSRSRKALRW